MAGSRRGPGGARRPADPDERPLSADPLFSYYGSRRAAAAAANRSRGRAGGHAAPLRPYDRRAVRSRSRRTARDRRGGRVSWSGRKVLVTGAGGFIGSHLAEALARDGRRGAGVRPLQLAQRLRLARAVADRALRDEVEIFRGDLGEPGGRRGCDQGARVGLPPRRADPDPVLVPSTRASSSRRTSIGHAERARGLPPRGPVRRVVHTSTSEVYGTALTRSDRRGAPAQRRSRPTQRRRSAPTSSRCSFQRSFETPVVVATAVQHLRAAADRARGDPDASSPRRSRSRRVELGATHPTRDFLYVEDTARGLHALRRGRGVEGEVINLGTGEEISIGELAETGSALARHASAGDVLDEDRLRPAKARSSGWSRTRARRSDCSTGSRRSTSTRACGRTIEWLEGSLDAYKPTIYNV